MEGNQGQQLKAPVISRQDDNKDTQCGVGKCYPKSVQKLGNMKLFIVNMSILQLFIIVFFTLTTGSLRTIEKRFELSSTQTGFLNSVGDIVQTCLVVFVGYIGGKVHKLRLLSGMLLIAGVGIFMTAVPYLIFGAKDLSIGVVGKSINGTDLSIETIGLCIPGEEFVDPSCAENASKKSNTIAYNLLVLANVILGLGTSGGMSLSISYIDENVRKTDAGLYIGILSTMFPIGPIVGFTLSAGLLKLPENLRESLVSPENPNFIGAWWLGYIISGIVIILASIPLFFFPKHMPQYYVRKAEVSTDEKVETTPDSTVTKTCSWLMGKITYFVKDFIRSIMRLLTNPAYLTVTGSYVCLLYVIIGLYSNLPRYMEIHFRQSAFMANVIAATSSAVAAAIGTLASGIVLKKLKISPLGIAKLYIATIAVSTASTFIKMWIACEPINMAGQQGFGRSSLDINLPCKGNCSCSEKIIQPVCAGGVTNYFSPCHAGCSIYSEEQAAYVGCSCIDPDVVVTSGTCEGPCNLVIAYIVVTFVASFVGSFGRVPVMVLSLRVIDEDMKTFAIALQSFAINLLSFVPGPIIFGALIDATCRVWQNTCGQSGVCLLYDTDRFRFVIHGVTTAFQFVGGLFAVGTFYFVRRDTLRGRWDDDPPKNNPEVNEKESELSKMNDTTITKL